MWRGQFSTTIGGHYSTPIDKFERSLIGERQREGVALAKAKGLYKGRKKALNEVQVRELQERVAQGEKKAILAKAFNIRRETIYQYLNRGRGGGIRVMQ